MINNLWQPFVSKDDAGIENIGYLSIVCDEDGIALHLTVTDVYNYAKEFKAINVDGLIETTFAINALSMDDRNAASVVFDNMLQLSKILKPVISEDCTEENRIIIDFNIPRNELVLNHDAFRYIFPLVDMKIEDQLSLTRQMYMNLEKFSNIQSQCVISLSDEIKNKNQVILKLSHSYYERVNPYGEKSVLNEGVFKTKAISQVFINKRMIKHMGSTPSEILGQSVDKNHDNTEIINRKWEKIWNKVTEKANELDKTETINIVDFGSDAETEMEVEEATSHHEKREPPKVKRKLQGILRRQNKKNKV